jgi:hypothetical protein
LDRLADADRPPHPVLVVSGQVLIEADQAREQGQREEGNRAEQ